jgi:hypothetical protein
MLQCSIMLRRNIAAARCIMKINLHVPGAHTEAALPQVLLPLLGGVIILAALVFLPGPALFLAGLAGAIALAVNLAELRRHGGPGVPHLPLTQEH